MTVAAFRADAAIQPLSLHPQSDRAGSSARALVRTADAVPLLGSHIGATIGWAVEVGAQTPPPGVGRTRETWETLATAAAIDVTAARALEPHLDALAILDQAKEAGFPIDLAAIGADQHSSWGVFAAEGARLEAIEGPDGWRLRGTKDWCSLAGSLTHALVTAWTGAETRRLFAVALRRPEVVAHRGPWVARGLAGIVSAPVDFDDAPAVPIGSDGWYLARPGFAWGGMGVAAVWWGAAAPLVSAVVERAASEHADQLAAVFAGDADASFWSVRAVLAEAADAVDAGVSGRDLKVTAERVRSVSASAAERIVDLSARALGPGPLTVDEAHARRVADLRIYLRQHHGERDLARLGRLLVSP